MVVSSLFKGTHNHLLASLRHAKERRNDSNYNNLQSIPTWRSGANRTLKICPWVHNQAALVPTFRFKETTNSHRHQ